MDFSVVKTKDKLKVYKDNKEIKLDKNNCFIIGNIYNLDKLKTIAKNKSPKDKVISLYLEYKDKLFEKLNGEYLIILIIDKKVILVKDRMGSKQVYYAKLKNEFIISTSLKYFIKNYKEELVIDKKVLSSYLCYSYITEPNTIFKKVYKLSAGSYLSYDSNLRVKKYYDLIKEYHRNKNKINKEDMAEIKIRNSLSNSIKLRTQNKNNIGIFFSAGIDSTLIASLATLIPDKKINTYTIGFYEEERNEAVEAKKIAKYLNTNHHEIYLDKKNVNKIVREIPKIYSEPMGDPSIIPTILLNQFVDKDLDIILTGDGADQLFCGSAAYDNQDFDSFYEKIIDLKNYIYHKIASGSVFISRKKQTMDFIDIKPKSYCNIISLNPNSRIRYMLYDLKTFLASRLFGKVDFSSRYYGVKLAHPFVDNDVVEKTLMLNQQFKYNKKEKKYILKKILYKNIPQEMFNSNKKGFGIPTGKWLYEIFKEDIIKLSNPKVIEKQGLFSVSKINNEMKRLENKELRIKESYVMFSYYMFQLWYKEYIEDLWK